MKVRIISGHEVENLITMSEAIKAVEKSFMFKGTNRIQMPPKSYIFFEEYNGDFRTMPSYIKDLGAAGVKVVNVHSQNLEKYSIPTVMATILLLRPENGIPLAIMNGTLITKMRTGAAGAVAAKYLAREDSKIVAMVGAGVQARTQLSALNEVFDICEVRVVDKVLERAKQYSKGMGKELGLKITPTNATEDAVRGADIVVTVTPRTSPLVMDEWISKGTHINAIGADAPKKQELDPKILKRSKIIVDDWEQASHSGEISRPLSESRIEKEDIFSEIGDIVAGKKKGRKSKKDITVFDSTGLAIQDIATAWTVYQKAKENDVGKELHF